MEEKICEKGTFWAGNENEKMWWMVKAVRMKVSWYDYEGVTNQEERDEDMVDEMSHKVDSKGEVMRIEMSDLWFSRLSEMEVERGWQVMMSECSEGTGEISSYIDRQVERYNEIYKWERESYIQCVTYCQNGINRNVAYWNPALLCWYNIVSI